MPTPEQWDHVESVAMGVLAQIASNDQDARQLDAAKTILQHIRRIKELSHPK